MALIVDTDGTELAQVTLGAVERDANVPVKRVVAGKGRLLDYYFVQGGRGVRLVTGAFSFHGQLATQWRGSERLWLVRLTPFATSTPHGAACSVANGDRSPAMTVG